MARISFTGQLKDGPTPKSVSVLLPTAAWCIYYVESEVSLDLQAKMIMEGPGRGIGFSHCQQDENYRRME